MAKSYEADAKAHAKRAQVLNDTATKESQQAESDELQANQHTANAAVSLNKQNQAEQNYEKSNNVVDQVKALVFGADVTREQSKADMSKQSAKSHKDEAEKAKADAIREEKMASNAMKAAAKESQIIPINESKQTQNQNSGANVGSIAGTAGRVAGREMIEKTMLKPDPSKPFEPVSALGGFDTMAEEVTGDVGMYIVKNTSIGTLVGEKEDMNGEDTIKENMKMAIKSQIKAGMSDVDVKSMIDKVPECLKDGMDKVAGLATDAVPKTERRMPENLDKILESGKDEAVQGLSILESKMARFW